MTHNNMLTFASVSAGYGPIRALKGVNLNVPDRGVIAVLGPNGAGKTTLVRTVTGLIRPTAGTITLGGDTVSGWTPEKIARHGVSVVPEGRHVFPGMSVLDNLLAGSYRHRRDRTGTRDNLTHMYELFPRLRDRASQLAGSLSGGEQQMLAVGRALMGRPRILILDEPSLGLAPRIVEDLYLSLTAVRAAGTAMLLIEQNVQMAATLCDRGYLLMNGRIIAEAQPSELRDVAAESYLNAG